MSTHKLGRGRFVLNTLRLRENLGSHPAADRLVINALNQAAPAQPEAKLDAAELEAALKAIGYP